MYFSRMWTDLTFPHRIVDLVKRYRKGGQNTNSFVTPVSLSLSFSATYTGRVFVLIFMWDAHGSVHRRLLSRNTNKMQFCNRIYCSKVYWRFNMFRAAHRLSSGVLNCVCSLWFIYTCGDRPLPKLSGIWISQDTWSISHSALAKAGHQPEAANTV